MRRLLRLAMGAGEHPYALALGLICAAAQGALEASPAPSGDLSPAALAAAPDGRTLYVACATAGEILAVDPSGKAATRAWKAPDSPSGLALTADGKALWVTCASPVSTVLCLDTASGKVLRTLPAGYGALSPVLAPDGNGLFVCNRFNDDVSVFDLAAGKERARIPVAREPVSAALTPDGRFLLVANHLPKGRADLDYVAATLSVVDVSRHQVVKELRLPNGAINLRQMACSPDGKYAVVALTIARFQLPITQLARGWVNTSALTLVDLATREVLNTVLLDDPDHGAANPWGVAFSADGKRLCVTHSGTHELSCIDFPGLLSKLARLPAEAPPASQAPADPGAVSRCAADVPNDLAFLTGLRRRIRLAGNGPRAVVVAGSRAFTADYFSDSLDVVDLSETRPAARPLALNPGHTPTQARRGEMYFNDATLCFQGWQSCASCHDDDGRVDAVQWDLLNDGIGNPKDTKSMVWAPRTPPSMSLGIRANSDIAVRSGIQNSLEAVQPEEVPLAINEWLKTLEPAPSPHLVDGRMNEAARRGEALFKNAEVGCAECHEPPLFTDLRSYNVGTRNAFDKGATDFDTPTLRELWRTAPYLHDGSAATLREVVTTHNPKDQHGKTNHLAPTEIDDLVEYLLSL